MRKLLVSLFVIVPAIAVLAWAGGWFAASSLSDKYINAWIEREKSNGRFWSCKDRVVQGFPLEFRIVCNNPTVASQMRGGRQNLQLQKMEMVYSPLTPRTAKVLFSGPARYEDQTASTALIASWDRLEADLHYPWPSQPRANARTKNFAVRSVSGTSEETLLTAQDVALALHTSSNANQQRTLSIALTSEGVSARALDEVMGNSQPVKLNTVFDVAQFERLLRGDPRARLEAWRDAGGSLTISELKANKGNLALEAEGRLGLDNLRRPAGNLNLRAAGLTSLMQRLGLPGGNATRGGLLGSLVRRPAGQPETSDQPGRFVPLPLVLRDGAVWLGPIKSPIALRPLL